MPTEAPLLVPAAQRLLLARLLSVLVVSGAPACVDQIPCLLSMHSERVFRQCSVFVFSSLLQHQHVRKLMFPLSSRILLRCCCLQVVEVWSVRQRRGCVC